MAYEVTATRRRPQKFEDLVGQEFVSETFKNSIQSGKIAHAYLFSGPRGCGKTSTARILAKALNCEKGPTATPCGECAACREITAGSSLDVIEIDGASNTSVNDVRQIKDEVLFPPNSCRYKIYIIDEVHMLSTSAFNALLKTIEEPPPYVIFVFATTELQKVPATIKSRCQQFNFRLVPIEKVKEQLAKAAAEVGIKAEDEALYWIARESTGSMRDSYTLFDQVAAFSDGEITYEKIRDKLGLVGVDRLNELFSLCVNGDSTNALLRLDEYIQNGISIEQLISNCTDYLRSLLLIKSGVTKEALLGQNVDRFSSEVLDNWNRIQIERALNIFLQLYRDIRYSLSPRFEFELAVSRLCWLKDYVSAAEVKKAIEKVKPLLMGRATASNVMGESGQSQQSVNTSNVQNSSGTSSPSPSFGGMPQFSALQEESSQGEPQRPFLDGGAEPPVNKSANGYGSFEPNKYASFASSIAKTVKTEEEYEEPDDFENGGFEDGMPSEADIAASSAMFTSQPVDNLQKQTTQIEKPQINVPETGAESDVVNILPSVGINVDNINSVRESIISDFSVSDALVASALMQTKNWHLENDNVCVTIEVAFERLQLQQNSEKITKYLSSVYGKQVGFIVNLEEREDETVEVALPIEVQILRDAFKGTLV